MKRKLVYFAGLVLIACAFTSCEALSGNCQVCALVSRNATTGAWISEESESEFCDEELLGIKAIPPVTTGGVTTGWECN